MGIHLGKSNRDSTAWVGRFDPADPRDMAEYEMVKAIVRNVNSTAREMRFRVENKGRNPTTSYTWHGSIEGGIKNATLWDVYIYRRWS